MKVECLTDIARVIAPETWAIIDAGGKVPEGVMVAKARSLEKAREAFDVAREWIARASEPPPDPGLLRRLATYMAGALDSLPMSEMMQDTIASWRREIVQAQHHSRRR